jgi:predicted phosphodiesterase
MFTHIFHLADIHIRSGNTEQARFIEFQSVFNRLISDVESHPAVKNGTAMVVVAGDVFHHKLRIESPGLKLALELFKRLGALCPVYVIRGNHDFRQDKPDEPDLIQSLVHLHNIHYIDETGTIVIDNVGFGIVTVQDLLQKGATSGMSRQIPLFPEPEFDSSVDYKVALFHGNLLEFPTGYIPSGYDIALLGDIHLQHVGGGVKPMVASVSSTTGFKPQNSYLLGQYSYGGVVGSEYTPYGYPGSLLQQDFGEPVLGHGYIVWNLPNKTIECYHLKNDANGYVTIRLNEGKDTWDIAVKRNRKR